VHVNGLDGTRNLAAEAGPAVLRVDDSCFAGVIHFDDITRAELCTEAASDTHVSVYATDQDAGPFMTQNARICRNDSQGDYGLTTRTTIKNREADWYYTICNKLPRPKKV
jgi:hypothetical protein